MSNREKKECIIHSIDKCICRLGYFKNQGNSVEQQHEIRPDSRSVYQTLLHNPYSKAFHIQLVLRG